MDSEIGVRGKGVGKYAQLVFDFGSKARTHEFLQKQYYELLAEIEKGNPDDEAEKKKWVQDAVKGIKKGALSKQEGKKKGEKFSKRELKGLKKSGTPLEKKRANFALNIQKKK